VCHLYGSHNLCSFIEGFKEHVLSLCITGMHNDIQLSPVFNNVTNRAKQKQWDIAVVHKYILKIGIIRNVNCTNKNNSVCR